MTKANEPGTTQARDRLAAAAALGVLLILAGVVVALVLDAQRAGIRTREELRLEQVNQLGASIDARVRQAFASLGARVSEPGLWNMVPGDPEDTDRLAPGNPTATSGVLLVRPDGVVVNGSLLRDPDTVGQVYEREGLQLALRGQTTILGVGPGATTTDPVFGIALPLYDDGGALIGAYVLESAVSPDSDFSKEVHELGGSGNISFTYVDRTGGIPASSDDRLLGRQTELPEDALRPGFHRLDDSVVAVAEVPTARWHLVFQQPLADFEGDVTRPVRAALLFLLVLVVLGGGVGVVALVRSLRSAREEHRRLAQISAAQEEFTSIVSHELRTPVAGLLGFLQTTVDHWDDMPEEERLRAVRRAQQNAERLQRLTTEVLESTSVDAGHLPLRLEVVDLRELVQETVETARLATAGRTFVLDLAPDAVMAEVDSSRIRQVLTNLLDNATKSSAPDTTVEIEVLGADGTATVRVSDRGVGVHEADRERIFEKFTRGAGTTRGSGLGLYLSREIVRAHGGRIWVEPRSDAGTSVAFTLPQAQADGA